MSSALARAVQPLMDRLAQLERRLSLVPSVWDATVTSIAPIRIQRDAEPDPIASSPETLIPVGAGDRVRVLHWGTRYLILGRTNTAGLPWRMAAGSVVVDTAVGIGQETVTFPAGRFTVSPRVLLTPISSASSIVSVQAAGVTADGFTAVLNRNSTSSTVLHWHAVQMTPTSAEG